MTYTGANKGLITRSGVYLVYNGRINREPSGEKKFRIFTYLFVMWCNTHFSRQKIGEPIRYEIIFLGKKRRTPKHLLLNLLKS